MVVSAKTYELIAEEDDERWELHCGRLRKKPPMTWEHAEVPRQLLRRLIGQLDPARFEVDMQAAKLRTSTGSYLVPDLCVIPTAYMQRFREHPRTFEVYDEPLPFVMEVWSPSTGDYNVTEKLPEYRRRGDAEIWLVHQYEHTVRIWRRQPDGSYRETLHHEGVIELAALPGVTIDLAELFVA